MVIAFLLETVCRRAELVGWVTVDKWGMPFCWATFAGWETAHSPEKLVDWKVEGDRATCSRWMDAERLVPWRLSVVDIKQLTSTLCQARTIPSCLDTFGART
jgi:hypothetical protein